MSFVLASLFAKQLNDGSVPTVGLFFVLFMFGSVLVASGIYMFRGQGPSTQTIEARLAAERKEVKAKRRGANFARFTENLTRRFVPNSAPTASTSSDAAAAAQINAIANTQTAQALQNLQNLLYTRAITDAEYRAAKGKLVGTLEFTDSFAQIAKLAELHEAGILGDMEFSAAKARALGL